MIDKAGEAIYAELLSTYGVDLVDAVSCGSPSPRLLLALIRGLPAGSWTSAMLNDCPELWGYTPLVAAVADVFDAVAVNTVVSGNVKRGTKPFLWPGRPKVERKSTAGGAKSLAEFAAMFENFLGG